MTKFSNRYHTAVGKILTRILTMILALVILPLTAQSADIEASLDLAVGYSDNVGRDADITDDETLGVVGGYLGLIHDSRKVSADVRSDLRYIYYESGDYDDEVVGGVDAVINLSIVEDRFSWLIQNNWGQQLVDPFQSASPGNRENVNYFTTGPSLQIPLGMRNVFQLDGTYSIVDYEESPFDNTGYTVSGALAREVREDALLSLNGVYNTTEYDESEFSEDFDRREGYLRFESGRDRDTIEFDVGYTELEFDDETNGGELVRVSWSRALSTVSSFSVSGGSDYSTQADRLRYLQSNQREIGDTVDVDGEDVPFRNNYASLGYNLVRQRSAVDLGLEWTQEDYEDRSDRDRDVWRALLILRRDFTRTIFGQLDVQYFNREYSEITREDDDLDLSAVLGMNLSQAVSVALQYQYFRRDSNLDTDEFTEQRVFLRLSYAPQWGRPRAGQ